MTFTKQNSCRLCGHNQLVDFFDLGQQTLSGCFPGPDEIDPPSAPLTLCRCKICQLVQLRHSTDPAKMFTSKYGYRSALNASMKTHLAELQNWTADRCTTSSGDLVVDIGANDGTLLGAWDRHKLQLLAIDPILNKFIDLYPTEIEQYQGFFTKKLAASVLSGRKAHVITSISMFYDLPDPNDFVAGIKASLAKDGIWVLEQSYLPSMLARNSFDTICHEHLEYYALAQIETLAKFHDLKIIDVQANDCNGGSFRLALTHAQSNAVVNQTAIQDMQKKERQLALDTDLPYAQFANRVAGLKTETVALLQQLKSQGKSVWVYGASTKGNVLLQHYGLGTDLLAGVVEVNSEKFGHRTPGSNLPIRNEEGILHENPDYFLVLPWHFRKNILARGQKYLNAGVKFIFPLPELEIIEKTNNG